MNNQNLIICDFKILYEILSEIEEILNFNLLNISKDKFSDIKLEKLENFLIISKEKVFNFDDQLIVENYPIELLKLIENINIKFLKKRFNQQSDISIGLYKLNLNSRKIFHKTNSLDLTEKEIQIIIFLKDSKKPVKVNQLQSKVWGHNSELDTHTVETHIYRLRKKIKETFNDDNFLLSKKDGYTIN